LVHVESVCGSGQLPPLLAGVVTLYVLVLVPGLEELIPSQVAAQALHSFQSPIQLTGQSVLVHVESVCGGCVGQLPPLLAGVVTLYVLVLVPGLDDIALIPSQVASQALHSFQSPIQLTGQSVLVHVESVCGSGQLPPLLAGVVTLYVLVLVPSLDDVALIPSQVAAQTVQSFQSPIQLT
jgi:uncharacterized membrane protein YjjB (DUF3815 family)